MPETQLPPIEETILAYVLGYYQDEGHSPTMQEIAEHASKKLDIQITAAGVKHHVDKLVNRGRLKRTKRGTWRNLAPITAHT